jgi:pseudouridine-5'-phosphate glycosidase
MSPHIICPYRAIAMDASADLTELGRTPVAVVCAGVKSILDIGRTLEFLETQGVTVATYGPTRDFPAFFTRTSGFKVRISSSI